MDVNQEFIIKWKCLFKNYLANPNLYLVYNVSSVCQHLLFFLWLHVGLPRIVKEKRLNLLEKWLNVKINDMQGQKSQTSWTSLLIQHLLWIPRQHDGENIVLLLTISMSCYSILPTTLPMRIGNMPWESSWTKTMSKVFFHNLLKMPMTLNTN